MFTVPQGFGSFGCTWISRAFDAVPHTGARCSQAGRSELNHDSINAKSTSRVKSSLVTLALAPCFCTLSTATLLLMPCCLAMERKIAEPQKISSVHTCPTCLSFQVRGTKGDRLHFECSWSGCGSWHFGSAHTCKPLRHRPPGFTPFSAHPADALYLQSPTDTNTGFQPSDHIFVEHGASLVKKAMGRLRLPRDAEVRSAKAILRGMESSVCSSGCLNETTRYVCASKAMRLTVEVSCRLGALVNARWRNVVISSFTKG